MKIRSFFDIIRDAKDTTDLFDGVENVEQMISRLERLKRGHAEEVLMSIQSLRMSIEAALEDTMEMGSSPIEEGDLDNFNDDDDDDLSEEDLKELGLGDEPPPAEEAKATDTPKVESKS